MKHLFYVLISGLLLSSCYSVDRTMKKVKTDPKLYEAVEKYVIVDKKACINDTTKDVQHRDSVVYKDTIIYRTIKSPCPDFTETLPDGVVVASKNGNLTVTLPYQYQENQRETIITNNIRDLKLEQLQRKDIDSLTSKLVVSSELQKQYLLDKQELTKKNDELRSKNTWLIIGIGITVLLNIFQALRRFLPL